MTDPRFYNPDGEEITLTDEVEFEEMIRKLNLKERGDTGSHGNND